MKKRQDLLLVILMKKLHDLPLTILMKKWQDLPLVIFDEKRQDLPFVIFDENTERLTPCDLVEKMARLLILMKNCKTYPLWFLIARLTPYDFSMKETVKLTVPLGWKNGNTFILKKARTTFLNCEKLQDNLVILIA